jgi:hypothetical protein
MSSVRTVRPGGPGLAGIIGLAIALGALALATVLLGTLTPPLFFLLYAFGDLAFFLHYYRRLISLSDMGSGPFARWIVGMTPVGCCALLLAVLRNWADPEVRDDWALQAGFVIAWGCAVIWSHVLGTLLGLDVLQHGVEGRNPAAVWAGVGLTIGATLATAGANVGQGPTEATTLGPLFLAVGGLLTLWATFSVITGSVAAVTVERDLPSGLRAAALLVALGLILGRSVAGDWVSVESTLRDYWRQGLTPAATLLGVAAVIEFLEQPTTRRPVTSVVRSGVGAAAVYLGFAVAWLWHLGLEF